VTLEECQSMIDAAQRNGVAIIAAGARSFDPAFVAMRGRALRGRRLDRWRNGVQPGAAPSRRASAARRRHGEERSRRNRLLDGRASLSWLLHGVSPIRGRNSGDYVVQRARLHPRVGAPPLG
jgi:predicted dehydrogenase